VPYLEREVRLDRVATLVTDPGSLPADVYKWGTPDFSADALLRVLEIVARAFGLGVGTEMTAGLDLYWDDDAVTALAQRSLVLPIWSSVSSGASAQADMLIVPLPVGTAPGSSATKPEGIALVPRFRGTASVDVEVV